MALDESPPFWWEKASWQAWMLSPIGYMWGKAAAQRMATTPSTSVDVPVICVGNFIVGGAGKTPTTAALAKHARNMRLKPGILSRGYGGGITTATIVKPDKHNANDVGDEPLLHAQQAITVVSADRASGAELLVSQGCDVIIMDDGFQNPSLQKDCCLIVVDAKRGLGNGYTMPAGPMRVPFKEQLRHVDATMIIGAGPGADQVVRRTARSGKPVFHGKLGVIGRTKWAEQNVLAFAGIADPEKFYETLTSIDANIGDRQSFGDHHHYTEEECEDLLERAERQKLQLITTAKDHVRLMRMGDIQSKLAEHTHVLSVELVPEDPKMFARILEVATEHCNRRKLSKTPITAKAAAI